METNEQIRRVLSKALEEELESFLEQVSQMTEGELKHLEKQVVKSSQAIGRKLMEGVLNSRLHERRPVARREGSCGHVQRLVGERPKELITLVGAVSGCRARTINACMEEKRKRSKTVRMEKRLLMRCGAWTSSARPLGCKGTSVSLRARLTFEEAAQTLCRSVPIGMSGRQALNLMRPVGEALAASEAQQVMALEAEARQARSLPTERQQQTAIERLYIELDGVLARMRRGSVPMEHEEVQRKGDVYREIKAGAVFRAEQGPKRSELAAFRVCGYASRRQCALCGSSHGQGRLWLVALPSGQAMWTGASEAGWWSWVTEPPGFGTWSPNTFQGPCRLWISIMPKNTCGTWLTPSLDAAQQWEQPGPRMPARCSNRGRVKRSSPRSLRCRPLPRSQGKRAVSQSGPWTTLPPTPSACAIRSSAPKACISAVASLRPPAKPSSARAPNGAACAGLLRASMRSRHRTLLFSYPWRCVSNVSFSRLTKTSRRGETFLLLLVLVAKLSVGNDQHHRGLRHRVPRCRSSQKILEKS